MRILSAEDRFCRLADTLMECGEYLLSEDDEMIGCVVFEDFDIDVTSCPSDENLQLFIDEGMISEAVAEKCRLFRDKARKVLDTPELHSVRAFRSLEEWREIMRLSDEIKRDIGIERFPVM